MGKIIGILNQKGGVGKSTLAIQLANAIYHNLNYKKKDGYVSLYDADNPQYSIDATRKEEMNILEAVLEDGNNFYDRKLTSIYNDNFTPLKIYTGDIKEVTNNIHLLKDRYDYSIIDVVGTVNTEGYDEDFINIFDFILVPTSNDFDVLRSTLSFVASILEPLTKNGKMQYGIVFNNVDGIEKPNLESTIQELRNYFHVLDGIVTRKKKLSRLYMREGSKGSLSTLFPTYEKEIIDLAEEIIKKLN